MNRLIVLMSLLTLSGCSVVMGFAGHDDPEISRLSTGLCREALEHEQYRSFLKQPKKITASDDSLIETYRLERNNVGSLASAAENLGLTLITGGLWELAGTFIEYRKPTKFNLVLEYTKNGPTCTAQTACPCSQWRLTKFHTVDLE